MAALSKLLFIQPRSGDKIKYLRGQIINCSFVYGITGVLKILAYWFGHFILILRSIKLIWEIKYFSDTLKKNEKKNQGERSFMFFYDFCIVHWRIAKNDGRRQHWKPT